VLGFMVLFYFNFFVIRVYGLGFIMVYGLGFLFRKCRKIFFFFFFKDLGIGFRVWVFFLESVGYFLFFFFLG
jgi:hypothetical protein